MVTGNSEGVGVSKAKFFKGKYEAKLEFPEGCGFKVKKKSVGGGMDIFWNRTINDNQISITNIKYL